MEHRRMSSPAVSVVMSVFNGERYLDEAIGSILSQTFRDFEFIVIDDGSTDSTPQIFAGYPKTDPRTVVHRQAHQGIIAALNAGCSLARGGYIARMDADDVALPERLQRQVEYLESCPKVGVVGSSINIIDADGKLVSITTFPTD